MKYEQEERYDGNFCVSVQNSRLTFAVDRADTVAAGPANESKLEGHEESTQKEVETPE